MSDTQANLRSSLDLDELLPPFVLTPREQRDGLSRKREAEKEDVQQRRVQLLSLLEELSELRGFFDDTKSVREHAEQRISQLETDVETAGRECRRVQSDARQTRLKDADFMLGILNARGQAAALAEVPGHATCFLVENKLEVTMTYGRVVFEASSSSSGIVVRSNGERTFARKMSLGESGFDTLELLGLAQVLGWSGRLEDSTMNLLSSPKADPPVVVAPPVPNPLQTLMQSARNVGCMVQISPLGK